MTCVHKRVGFWRKQKAWGRYASEKTDERSWKIAPKIASAAAIA
jgi:hypothetical protein